MRNLLQAGFARLRKNFAFWLCMAASALWSGAIAVIQYRERLQYPASSGIDNILWEFTPVVGLFCAVFVCLFIGVEHSDGTMRNKVSVGHTRADIYFSNLTVCVAADLLIMLAWVAVTFFLGVPLLGAPQMAVQEILIHLLLSALTVVSTTAILLLAAMLLTNKAASAVACILLALALLVAGSYVYGALQEPEIESGGLLVTENGTEWLDPQPNPRYLQGAKRTVYEALALLLPAGQQIMINDQNMAQPWAMALCSVLVTALAAGVGFLIFRKKDLK